MMLMADGLALDVFVFSFTRGLDVRSRVGCIQVKFIQLLKRNKFK